jgi:D-3-phosphoglycerate dehydrogenase
MAANTKRVFYVKYLAHTVFTEIIGRRPDITLDRLDNDSPTARVDNVLAQAHAYQISSARDEILREFYAETPLLGRAPNLLVVSTGGAGYDTVDLDACTAAGVLAVNQAGGNREAVAEHALGMMLCLTKRIIAADRCMRREVVIDRTIFMGHDLVGKTVGIIGIGHVGTRLAELCRALFGMRVLATDPYLDAATVAARGAEKVDLETLLASADFVSVNCPRTAETVGMIGARAFALMRPGTIFITTARGGIHDEAALAAALAEGRLAGAGLDVWAKEPPPLDHPLLGYDNVVVSPHTAGVTHEARHNIARIAAEQLIDILDGKPASRVLNPAVWPRFAARFEQTFGFAPAAG